MGLYYENISRIYFIYYYFTRKKKRVLQCETRDLVLHRCKPKLITCLSEPCLRQRTVMLSGEDLNRVISCIRNQSSLMCTLNWMLHVVLSAGLCRSLEDVVVHEPCTDQSCVRKTKKPVMCWKSIQTATVSRHELHVCVSRVLRGFESFIP